MSEGSGLCYEGKCGCGVVLGGVKEGRSLFIWRREGRVDFFSLVLGKVIQTKPQ